MSSNALACNPKEAEALQQRNFSKIAPISVCHARILMVMAARMQSFVVINQLVDTTLLLSTYPLKSIRAGSFLYVSIHPIDKLLGAGYSRSLLVHANSPRTRIRSRSSSPTGASTFASVRALRLLYCRLPYLSTHRR